MNGGEQNTASGSLSVVCDGQNTTAYDTAVIAGSKENETEGGFAFIGGDKKHALVHLVLLVADLRIKL